MTIKCFFGDYSSHVNEQRMLDNFLTQLQSSWGGENRWVYAIYNAMWSGQEIDLVCITSTSIIVADFKNYSGELVGQENGEWQIKNLDGEDVIVKGGGQINPFVQVRKNKYAVIEWLRTNELLLNENTGHTAGLIIFNELKSCDISLSRGVKQWFHTSDIPHINEKLLNISSKEINITEHEAEQIIEKLNVKAHQWTPKEPVQARFEPFPPLSNPVNNPESINYSEFAKTKISPENFKAKQKLDIKNHVYIPLAITALLSTLLGVSIAVGMATDSGIYKFAKDNLLTKNQVELITNVKQSIWYNPNHLQDDRFTDLDNFITPKKNQGITNLFQLMDFDNGKVYGLKLGKDTKSTFEKIVTPHKGKHEYEHNIHDRSKSTLIPSANIYNNNEDDLRTKKIEATKRLNKSLPPINIENFEHINLKFDEDDVLQSLSFYGRHIEEVETSLKNINILTSKGYEIVSRDYNIKSNRLHAVLRKDGMHITYIGTRDRIPVITFMSDKYYNNQ